MAEAHSAVAFSFAVTHEGLDVNFDWHVLRLVLGAATRSTKKRIARFKNSVSNGVYPASVQSLVCVIVLHTALLAAGYNPFGRHVNWVDGHILRILVSSDSLRLYLSGAVFCLAFWFAFILGLRYTLKFLFVYKGWMYEPRGGGKPVSKLSKLWVVMVKLLAVRKPMLYSFQGSLPGLPVPSVEDTMARYLRSVRPFLDDEKYARMERLAREFKEGIATKLQRYLVLKSWFTSNYVSDWWEEYVYLRGRAPIMVNSNFYGMDTIFMKPTNVPAARAGNMVHFCLLFRRAIERQELEPIMLQGTVPLCSWQYERVFNTCRIPGVETDKVFHLHDSSHIAVYHNGCWYKVIIHYKGRLLQPCEIERQMQTILDSEDEPANGESHLGALTAGDRVTWARARQTFFAKGVNRASLDCIEKAAFVVVFDREDFNFDMSDPNYLDHFGRALLHGKGYDRWYDKSFNLVFGRNGRVGFNAEHSWADAAIMSHVWEFVMSEDVINGRYDEDGHCSGRVGFEPPAPIRLKWDVRPECVEVIEGCVQAAQVLLGDVDLRILLHNAYGKGFMKTCKVSPDAYLQMALQLAYYRDSAKFCLTYEASMTRLFREGRTETVRPCTVESSQWVRSMDEERVPASEKIKLLKTACDVHQHAYQDAMCGKGIDRHLFCLYVISKYLELDSPFLKEVLSEPWRLSTSQTPHGQTQKLDLRKHPKCISAGGGFGPVADDGYGVSYIIAGENMVFFHISSKKSSPETDSSRFAAQIEKALRDMKALFLTK